MSVDQQDDSQDQNENGTPSTASRIKPAPVENAFPTPPRRDPSRASEPYGNRQHSPATSRLFGLNRASPVPKEHKSAEALRSNLSRGYSSGRSSGNELDNALRKQDVSRKTSQYFDQTFALRESHYSAKERVTRDSMMVVEIQLSCCLDKDQGFLNDLLMTMSEIYHRPTNNIMIVTTSDASIMMSGSTEPAYLISMTALPSEIASLKNLRATMMIQEFLAESLKIPASRGVVKFHTVKEEELGTNGMTVRDEIEKIEADEKRGLSLRSRQSTRTKRGSTLPSMSEAFSDMDHSRSDTPILLPNAQVDNEDEEKVKPHRSISSAGKMMKGKKSIMSFWKRA